MKRKSLASTVAVALAASTVSLISSPAVAAGQNPYDTFDATVGSPAGAIVGVGSDTTQIVVHALTDAWNTSHTPKLSSFAADGLPATVDLRDSADQAAINRSTINGSGNGKKLLFGATNNAEVNFARSSSSLSAAETSAGLQQAAFAVDGLKMAVSTTTNAPASITPQQVVDIYKGVITNWSQIDPAKSGVIKAYHPQTGSGTYTFFKSKLDEVNGGTVTFAGTVGVSQEHSPTEIQADPNAIGPFSTARASNIGTIQLLGGTDWKRAVYNVVRGADTTNVDIAAAFGSDGFVCSAEGRAVIEEIGFVPLATADQGGKCGVWTQTAVTDFTSFDDAGATTTTLAGSAAGSTVTLTATIGGLTTDGSVTFREGGTQVGSVVDVVAGQATLSLPGVAAGSHSYTAHFAPADPQLAGESSSAAIDVVVKKTATVTLTMTPATQQYFARPASAKATVVADGAPATGSVQFLRSGVSLGTVALSNGVATKALAPTTKIGTYTITAKYLGTDDTSAATAAQTFKILRAPSTTTGRLYASTVRSTANGKVITKVKITGGVAGIYAPGSVRVYKGTAPVGAAKALVKGNATVVLPRMAVGTHKLRVKYLGSTNVKPSYSGYFTLRVVR